MFPSAIQNNRDKLLSSLNSQRLDGKFCDVNVSIGKTNFTAHLCVLAAYSPTILSNHNINNCSCKDPLRLNFSEIKDLDNNFLDCCDCVYKVIEFMYTGNINFQREHLKHIEAVGSFLGMSDILLICQGFDKLGLCVDNSLQQNTVHDDDKVSYNVDDFFMPLENAKFPYTSDDEHSEQLSINEDSGLNENLFNKLQKSVINASIPLIQRKYSNSKNTAQDPLTCSKCDLKFSNSVQLRRHRETHLGKLYTCYTCKYSSQKAFQLIKHLLESNHKESVCSLCMLEAENPDKLKKHLDQHNHPKPFFCTVCNLRFPTRAGLNSHTPKHSTETPYRCLICLRGFKWKHNLQSHMVIHTTEKKHLCEQCGFSTAHKSTFSAHELSHTGYTFKCPHVGCKFISVLKRNVSSHLETHSKQKSYQCEICGQSFSQSKNLRRHAIKHDAMTDFDCCPLCLFKTMRYDKLKEHFKKHHHESDMKLLPPKKKKSNLNVPMLAINSPSTFPGGIPIESSPQLCISNEYVIQEAPICLIMTTDEVEALQFSPLDLRSTEVLGPEPDM